MPTWLGEIQCPKCSHWQIPMKFCPACGYDWSGQRTWTMTIHPQPDPESTAGALLRRCRYCGELEHGSGACKIQNP